MVKYGTLEYFKKLAEAVNNDEVISKSGLTMTVLSGFTDLNKAFLTAYQNGKVKEVKEVKMDDKADFITKADYAMMAGIAKGEIDARTAKPKFSMIKAMQNMKALTRLGEITKKLPDVEY